MTSSSNRGISPEALVGLPGTATPRSAYSPYAQSASSVPGNCGSPSTPANATRTAPSPPATAYPQNTRSQAPQALCNSFRLIQSFLSPEPYLPSNYSRLTFHVSRFTFEIRLKRASYLRPRPVKKHSLISLRNAQNVTHFLRS